MKSKILKEATVRFGAASQRGKSLDLQRLCPERRNEITLHSAHIFCGGDKLTIDCVLSPDQLLIISVNNRVIITLGYFKEYFFFISLIG